MSADEHWDAAETLLGSWRNDDEDSESPPAPDTSTVKQFEAELGALCEQSPSDTLLGQLSGELYRSNEAFYSL